MNHLYHKQLTKKWILYDFRHSDRIKQSDLIIYSWAPKINSPFLGSCSFQWTHSNVYNSFGVTNASKNSQNLLISPGSFGKTLSVWNMVLKFDTCVQCGMDQIRILKVSMTSNIYHFFTLETFQVVSSSYFEKLNKLSVTTLILLWNRTLELNPPI